MSKMANVQGFTEVDPIDPDLVAPLSVDWGPWLKGLGGGASILESSWGVSPGLTLGDGVATFAAGGLTVIPGAPSVEGTKALARVYLDGNVEAGGYVSATNFIRTADLIYQASLLMRVVEK